MKLTTRLLLIPLVAAVLGVGGIACSSDKKDSATATPTRPATTAASPAPVATATTTPAAVAVATATVAAPAPANTPVPPPPPAQPTTPPPPAPPAAGALSVAIADFNFTPTTLTGRVGQPVTISVRNTGAATHTFSIQNGPSSGNIAGGASATVQYTLPTSTGGVRFFCMIHGSMQGTITVTN